MEVRCGPVWMIAAVLLVAGGPASAGDGVVALQTAEPSCADDSGNRYVGCGNGTVTDNQTGLVWLANASCFGELTWYEAMETVAGLGDLECGEAEGEECDCGLSDGSSPGEWRLPSRDELTAMIEDAAAMLCDPLITTDPGTSCWVENCEVWCVLGLCLCSFYEVQSSWYWSSSPYVSNASHSWIVSLSAGNRRAVPKEGASSIYAWPVRGGQ